MQTVARFIGACILLSACTLPAAQRQWDQGKLWAQQSQEAQQKGAACAQQQDWQCALYWEQVAADARGNAWAHVHAGNAIQQNFANALRRAADEYDANRAATQTRPSLMQQEQMKQAVEEEVRRQRYWHERYPNIFK